MQLLAFLVLPVVSLLLWIGVTGYVSWPALALHLLAPAVLSYLIALRNPSDARGMAVLIGLGSAVAVLAIGFLLLVASITAGNLQ